MPTGETKKSFFGLIEDTVTKTEYVDEFTGYSDKEIAVMLEYNSPQVAKTS